MQKKKILFIAQNLNVGGVQTSLINLLHELSGNPEYQIDLFTFSGGMLINKLPKTVYVIYGNKQLALVSTPFSKVIKSKNIINIFIRIFLMIYVRIIGSERLYRKIFENCRIDKKYNAVISYFNDVPNNYFNQGTNLYALDYANAEDKIAWIHTDPIISGFNQNYCRKIYKNFDKIICVSKAVKEKMDLLLPEYSKKTQVIYNKFNRKEIELLSNEYQIYYDKNKLNIITVARVDNTSKRINEIVNMCLRLKNEGIVNFCWRIIGDGPDLVRNKKEVHQLELGNLIIFEGEKLNPYPYMKHSDLFALYSAYEGFPMVIGEAIALGIPVLTKEYAAAREQISVDKGYVAKSDEEFYDKLKQSIMEKSV